MSEILEKLGPIMDAATSGSSGYDTASKIERFSALTALGLGLAKGYKQRQYEDRVNQDAMDQWIQQGKLKDSISKLRQEKEEIKSYTDALQGIPLNNKTSVQNAIGDQIWQEVINTNESLRNAGKAADFPTYADFQQNKKFFNPAGARLLEEAYQEKLDNTINRVKTGRKIDIPLLQSHYNEIEKNQMNTDFIADASIVDLYGGRTEKQFKQKQDILAKYTNVFLTDSIKDNSIAFEDLKSSKTLAESREKLLNHKFSDIARMSNTNLAIHHMLPDVVRKESFNALNSAFAARELVLGRRLTKDEIDEESNMVMFSMTNPTEGVRAAYKQRAADLKNIYRNTSLTPEQKKLQIGMVDIALAKHIKAVGSMGDFSKAELKIHEMKGLEGIENTIIDENAPGAEKRRARLRIALSAPQSIRASLVNSIIAENQAALQRAMNPSEREAAIQAEQKLLTALKDAGLPPTKNNVDLVVTKNPSLAVNIGPASTLRDSKIYWKDYKSGFNEKALKNNIGIYDSVMTKAETVNPKLYYLMKDQKNNIAFKGAMSAWLANTKQGFDNLNNEQYLVRSFGNDGVTVSSDRAFYELISGDILLKAQNEIINERDNTFVTGPESSNALAENKAREIYSALSNKTSRMDTQLQSFKTLYGLSFVYNENGEATDEVEINDDVLQKISVMPPKEAAQKLNNYIKNWSNKINDTPETEEEKQKLIEENITDWEEAIEDYPELELEFNPRTNNFRTTFFSPVDEIQNRIDEIDDILGKQTRRVRSTKSKERQVLDQERDDLQTLRGTRNLINMFRNKTQMTEKEKENLTKAEQIEIKLSNKYGY